MWRFSLGLFGLFVGAAAQAAPVTFNFTGRVSYVDPVLSYRFQIGDGLQGYFVFEPTTTAEPSPIPGVLASYPGAMSLIHMTVGDYTARFSGDGYLTINNDRPGFGDGFLVSTTHTSTPEGDAVGSYSLSSASFSLKEPAGVLLDSLALPTSASFLANQLLSGGLTFTRPHRPNVFYSAGVLFSDVRMTDGQVPEPGGAALVGLAVTALAASQMRRRTL